MAIDDAKQNSPDPISAETEKKLSFRNIISDLATKSVQEKYLGEI